MTSLPEVGWGKRRGLEGLPFGERWAVVGRVWMYGGRSCEGYSGDVAEGVSEADDAGVSGRMVNRMRELEEAAKALVEMGECERRKLRRHGRR